MNPPTHSHVLLDARVFTGGKDKNRGDEMPARISRLGHARRCIGGPDRGVAIDETKCHGLVALSVEVLGVEPREMNTRRGDLASEWPLRPEPHSPATGQGLQQNLGLIP
jgi:hypothetical protein